MKALGALLALTLKGFVSVFQIRQNKVTLVSSAHISYDETKYTQEGGFGQSQVTSAKETLHSLQPGAWIPDTSGKGTWSKIRRC